MKRRLVNSPDQFASLVRAIRALGRDNVRVFNDRRVGYRRVKVTVRYVADLNALENVLDAAGVNYGDWRPSAKPPHSIVAWCLPDAEFRNVA